MIKIKEKQEITLEDIFRPDGSVVIDKGWAGPNDNPYEEVKKPEGK